jgi:putative transposase
VVRHALSAGEARRFRTLRNAGAGDVAEPAALGFTRRRCVAKATAIRSKVDCYDNALCESFFAALECELPDRTRFRTQAEARLAIFDFIEGWYNPHRRHSSLGYASPIEYERKNLV